MGYLPPGALSESQFLHQVLGKGCRRWRTCPISLPTNSSPPPQSAAPTSGWWHRLYQQSPAPSPVDPLGPHTKLAFFWFWKSLSQMACQINVHTRLQK